MSMTFLPTSPGSGGSGDGGGGDVPYGGTRVVTVDPNATEVAGKVYTTIADAQAYIDTQDAPTQTTPWEIRVYGTITESVTVRSYEKIIGVGKGSVISGAINSNGTIGTDYYERVIENCKISKVALTGTNACVFSNCEILNTDGTPVGGIPIFINSAIYNGNFSSAGTIYFYGNCVIFGGDFSTSNNVMIIRSIIGGGTFGSDLNCYHCSFIGGTDTTNFAGGDFSNCQFDSAPIINLQGDTGTYNFYTCSIKNDSALTPGSGVTINIYNCYVKSGIASSYDGTINVYIEQFQATDDIPQNTIQDAVAWTFAQATAPKAEIHETIPGVADDDAIATSQSPAAGGAQNLTLTSSPYEVANYPKLVTITSDSDCSGINVSVTGLDENGDSTTETITGPNAETVSTTEYFTEVSQIQVSGDCTNIQAGYSQALVTIDFSINIHEMTLNEDVEFEFTTYAPTSGYRRNVAELYISGGGDVAITWPSIRWENGVTPSLSSNNDLVVITLLNSIYRGFHSGGNMS